MKKILSAFVIVAAVAVFVSCNLTSSKSEATQNDSTQVDTIKADSSVVVKTDTGVVVK